MGPKDIGTHLATDDERNRAILDICSGCPKFSGLTPDGQAVRCRRQRGHVEVGWKQGACPDRFWDAGDFDRIRDGLALSPRKWHSKQFMELAGSCRGRSLALIGNGPSHREPDFSPLLGVEGIDAMCINKPHPQWWTSNQVKWWVFTDRTQWVRHRHLLNPQPGAK